MNDFNELKKYVFNTTEEDVSKNKFAFYNNIRNDEVKEAEEKLGIKFPNELINFYNTIGYGFVRPDMTHLHEFFNRIMAPSDILELINGDCDDRRGDYDNLEYIPFYEVSEFSCLAINIKESVQDGMCKIYYYKDKIADSLLEFLNKMESEADYYVDDEEDEEDDDEDED